MIPENANRVYLALGSTDMRKAINGLSVIGLAMALGQPQAIPPAASARVTSRIPTATRTRRISSPG